MEHYITELNNRNHYVEEVSLPGVQRLFLVFAPPPLQPPKNLLYYMVSFAERKAYYI